MKKTKKILIVIVVIVFFVVTALFIHYLTSTAYIEKKVDELSNTDNYIEIDRTFIKFFNRQDYKDVMAEKYNEDFNVALCVYEAKLLTTELILEKSGVYIEYLTRFVNDIEPSQMKHFYENFYHIIITETAQNNELYDKILSQLNEIDVSLGNTDYDNEYASFICFLNFPSHYEKSEKIIQKLQYNLGDSFGEFWDNECLKYCGALLSLRDYSKFNTVFLKAYQDRIFSTKSIAIMINLLNFDKEQLQILSDALIRLSKTQKNANKKKSLEMLACLAVDDLEGAEAIY